MITVYTDGASSGNPGPGWAMYVIEESKVESQKSEVGATHESHGISFNSPVIIKNRIRLEHCTNNDAEYLAVIHALKHLINNHLQLIATNYNQLQPVATSFNQLQPI